MSAVTLWNPDHRPFRRALVVTAHPDDAEFSAAGTIARWVAQGTEVGYLVLTDGASGSGDPTMTKDRLRDLRRAEQEAACQRLGVTSLEWGGFADGYLQPTIEARRIVAAAVRRHRPEVVVTMDPQFRYSTRGYVNHPDHRAAGELVLDCINPAASTRLYDLEMLAEGLEPWDTAQLWLSSFGPASTVVDITETFATKVAALRCHASQLLGGDPEPRVREWAAAAGGAAGVELGEGFEILPLGRLRD